jgi:hypothetical protein
MRSNHPSMFAAPERCTRILGIRNLGYGPTGNELGRSSCTGGLQLSVGGNVAVSGLGVMMVGLWSVHTVGGERSGVATAELVGADPLLQ